MSVLTQNNFGLAGFQYFFPSREKIHLETGPLALQAPAHTNRPWLLGHKTNYS